MGETHAQVNRSLRPEFCTWLRDRPWDIAFLQEAPPRWLRALCEASGASGAGALTSRNFLAPLRAAVAERNPDLIASGEGGSNQLLLRPPAHLLEVRRLTLRLRPERRRMLWGRLELAEGRRLSVANLHATAGDPPAAAEDVLLAAERAVEWAGGDPLVFGGDLNLRPGRQPETFEAFSDRFALSPSTGPGAIDHVLARGLEVVEHPAPLPAEERDVSGPRGLRLRLSDHAPVRAGFAGE